jgi:hypothetical protein
MALLGTEGNYNREWLISNLGGLSFENIVVASGSGVLPSGRMLGKITAGGKYDNYDDGAANGTQTCVGILLDEVDATSADVNAVMVARLAEVKNTLITAETGGHKAAGVTDLATAFVLFR